MVNIICYQKPIIKTLVIDTINIIESLCDKQKTCYCIMDIIVFHYGHQ